MNRYLWPLFTLFAALCFLLASRITPMGVVTLTQAQPEDRVVISAPVQLLLNGGDRFLAANLETMRLTSTVSESNDSDTTSYLVRATSLVTQLNPCHEDSYYLGSALLSWGGAEKEGSILLKRATECRHWDWIPAFFYGFNQLYFHNNSTEAQRALELAAQRSPENYASLQKTAIMIATGQIDDDRMALDYLRLQRDQVSDPKLKKMLEKRAIRLEGLISLREAQQRFEKQFNRPLHEASELLSTGLLEQFPKDPLGIGYEFTDGVFMLRKLKIAGMEEKR